MKKKKVGSLADNREKGKNRKNPGGVLYKKAGPTHAEGVKKKRTAFNKKKKVWRKEKQQGGKKKTSYERGVTISQKALDKKRKGPQGARNWGNVNY